jgi:DNA-binding CsgD family transcriptional regulator
MADQDAVVEAARDAYVRRDWEAARDGLDAARTRGEVTADDLAALGDAHWWLGECGPALSAYEQAHGAHLAAGRREDAARLAVDLAFLWSLRGEPRVGAGWAGRARRLLDDLPEGPAHGYLRLLHVEEALAEGDHGAAVRAARQMHDLGARHEDVTLAAVGLASEGVARARAGEVAAGLAAIDEAMLPVVAGEVAPEWAGHIYCLVISICHDLGDPTRARGWTAATERWCEGFTSAVMFTGVCRVHRAQLLQAEGAWERAEREARRVCRELQDMNVVAVGEAHYQIGELCRLRGDLRGAEEAYGEAATAGRDPHPGLALLRLAQGRHVEAEAAIDTALAGAGHDELTRAPLAAAAVEIRLARGDLHAAETALAELDRIATSFASPSFTAASHQARGAVLLEQRQAGAAIDELREALRCWQQLQAPHAVAQVRVLLGRALRLAGTPAVAEHELRTAETAFLRLGAVTEAQRAAAERARGGRPDGLTDREIEVLAVVAEGASNREVALVLSISEKTVARHLSNIFTKLGLRTRTAAAAYAIRHGLVSEDMGGTTHRASAADR